MGKLIKFEKIMEANNEGSPEFQDNIDGQINDGNEEEFVFESKNENEGDDKFDLYVGALQDICMTEEFEKLRKDFAHKYCMEFEATEENKLSYTSIFKEYQDTIEGYLLK